MFAIIETGGKQYSVREGARLKVEKLAGAVGERVALNRVLCAGDQVGAPVLEKACVYATIEAQEKSDKVLVFKKRRRQHYRRFNGHRQQLTALRIESISLDGAAPKADAKPKAAAAEKSVKEAGTSKKAPAKATSKAASKTKE